jgi:hypothetical protein
MVGKQHSSDYRLSAIKHYEKSGSFSYAFDKDAVKKEYKRNSTLKRKKKVYL